MASPELKKLWKLQQIDTAILEIRKRAATLDPGRKIKGEIDALQAQLNGKDGGAKTLSAELHDLELAQKGLDDKLAKIDKELYGGKIVNPREVEAFEKEKTILKKQRAKQDERILELWELLPPAKKISDEVEAKLAAKQKELTEYAKQFEVVKAQLEADFKARNAERPEAAKLVQPALLAKYENIRQRHGGIGMAEIVKRTQCSGCGTMLPERTLQGAREDRLVTCESCHRILYFSEGVV